MSLLFLVFAALALASALGVVLSRSPVHCALSLVLHLFMIAVLYGQLGADFLAVAQIIVYAGAIMVLVLFVVMLLGLVPDADKTSLVTTFLALLAAVGLLSVFVPVLMVKFSTPLAAAPLGFGSVESIGKLLYTKYTFAFEAASILIIAAIIGAVALARRQKGIHLAPRKEA